MPRFSEIIDVGLFTSFLWMFSLMLKVAYGMPLIVSKDLLSSSGRPGKSFI